MSSLTQKVLSYQQCPEQSPPLAEVATHLYSYAKWSLHLPQEVAMETLSDFYGRLPVLIDTYRNCGSSFDAYVATSFRLHVRSYYRRNGRLLQKDKLSQAGAFGCFERHGGDGLTLDSDFVAETHTAAESSRRDRSVAFANPRRLRHILYMTVKNIAYFHDSELPEVAASLEVSAAWLAGVRQWAQEVLKHRARRREELMMLRDTYYVRLIQWEQALNCADDPTERAKCQSRVALYRRRLSNSRRRLRTQPMTLTHGQVAAVLGVPKGSVDSAIASLRKRLANDRSAGYRVRNGRLTGKQQRAQAPRDRGHHPSI